MSQPCTKAQEWGNNDVAIALHIPRDWYIPHEMIITTVVNRSQHTEGHFATLQFIMDTALRNDDDAILPPRAYQLKMLEKSLRRI